MKLTKILFAACAVIALASCARQPEYATRVEKILAETVVPTEEFGV